ncbi:ABC transporter ATP-binding protein [Ectobacillus ponti]|uniref:Carnitine transport ATP-binding protein OpuCA n=1 Tax=Ectobacillus ponti TaxID=2961894 RepID=A0AA41XDJ6_9BACI|nr:ABC transporter ATP-binding protein [Ectobacillus ponti]MCP8970920.1 ABC transporter ATP-binding protein [Ectobacillus ponti]
MSITFTGVTKSYPGSEIKAVDHVDLSIEDGEFIVILGPSGCGKTTLLKMVNRLFEPTAGTIAIDGTDITSLKVETLRRRIGYVIQQNGLFPHMSIEENIAVVPKLLGWDKERIRARVEELLDLVHLDQQVFRKRYPRQLSGGQQQRVGIARAMAADPAILLMDEPFGAIDAITRISLQDELLRIHKQLHKTIMFVTHDVEEAFKLADRIIIMQSGKVVQFASPGQIMAQPANDFVKQLVGVDDMQRRINVLKMRDLLPVQEGSGGPLHMGPDTVSVLHAAKDVLARFIETKAESLKVLDSKQRLITTMTLMEFMRKLGSMGAAHADDEAPKRTNHVI